MCGAGWGEYKERTGRVVVQAERADGRMKAETAYVYKPRGGQIWKEALTSEAWGGANGRETMASAVFQERRGGCDRGARSTAWSTVMSPGPASRPPPMALGVAGSECRRTRCECECECQCEGEGKGRCARRLRADGRAKGTRTGGRTGWNGTGRRGRNVVRTFCEKYQGPWRRSANGGTGSMRTGSAGCAARAVRCCSVTGLGRGTGDGGQRSGGALAGEKAEGGREVGQPGTVQETTVLCSECESRTDAFVGAHSLSQDAPLTRRQSLSRA
ncbi:hypothetical protein L226DRAFT_36920 [Lentinus tigrinus ALCF2SS1-7]|uniref:Uncharacterized protein n=1 Tax=Lentinus tigrinus ALCF2SS1-6 TaxID=1328759 RepID=A0A5C2STU4_9APHY|nr:hypothetical protein L227DRAFT_266697 [Lentinus tigrinus ALCF2SS1-6]RPD82770.1 hypothetical protein L226DRAFT_36920 [Lentinus tigrinus ALCF2SS1-7]